MIFRMVVMVLFPISFVLVCGLDCFLLLLISLLSDLEALLLLFLLVHRFALLPHSMTLSGSTVCFLFLPNLEVEPK